MAVLLLQGSEAPRGWWHGPTTLGHGPSKIEDRAGKPLKPGGLETCSGVLSPSPSLRPGRLEERWSGLGVGVSLTLGQGLGLPLTGT